MLSIISTISDNVCCVKALSTKLKHHQGKDLSVKFSSSQGVTRYMKLLVFREEAVDPDAPLIEARSTKVSADFSQAQATLLRPEQSEAVHESDKVITK
jgi:hypothetical protein